MPSDRKIRVAIVGLGFGAEFIPIYQAHPNAEMYAICRRNEKALKECGDKPEDIVPRAWRLAFGRPPTPAESERALTFLRRRTEAARQSGEEQTRPSPQEVALTELCLVLFNANEFVYVD